MPSAPQAQAQGRKAGAVNYTREETMHLLEALKAILPIGPDEWNEVLSLHSVVYPTRDRNSISRKYNILHRKSIPTGDPHCPPEVRMAKNIKYLIGAKADIGDAEEHYDLVNGYDSNDSDIPPAQLAAPPLRQPSQLDQLDGGVEDLTQNVPAALSPPTKRSYGARSSSQDVVGAFENSIAQQKEARKQDREEQREAAAQQREARNQDREEQREARVHDRQERKETMDDIGKILVSMASTVASAFAPILASRPPPAFAPVLAPRPNKRRRHHAGDDDDLGRHGDDDSDSEDDSY